MDFIRPAARAHWFERDDDEFWGTSEPDEEPLVPGHPDSPLICHPSSSFPATAAEARSFWLRGGWDD